jgi:hypothetical protein
LIDKYENKEKGAEVIIFNLGFKKQIYLNEESEQGTDDTE